jgi:two-component system chemotaxis response regulator CheB
MVVDDSTVARGLMSRWLAEEPDLKVVASLRTGREAVDWIERDDADVAVLDIDMPELDGLSALPLLLARKRDLVVIMASTLTRRNAETSLKALSLGAADYIGKPEARRGGIATGGFRRELIDKVRMVGGRRHRLARWRPPLMRGLTPAQRSALCVTSLRGGFNGPLHLRPASSKTPRVLLLGASTGGPQALLSLLPQLDAVADRLPVLIVQHMPATFTTILSEHLARATGRPAREAVDGEPIVRGSIYLAPGGRHMRVACRAGRPVIALDDGPPINFCRPAVDPLFETASDIWGPACLALILTGMGSDGTSGARAIAAAGGTIIAQDEATSAVWGMPGSAAHAGVCSAVLPLPQLAGAVSRLLPGAAA